VQVPGSPTPSPAPSAAAPSGSTLAQSTDWVTFGHDLSRTSLQPSSGGITAENVANLQLLWSYKSSAEYDTAGAIESGGVVYAADYAGNLVALNAETGAVEWTKSLGAEVKMTPAVFDGRLFVATYVDTTPSSTSTFFALDPHTGNTLWSRTINGGVHGSPVAIAGTIYVPVSIGDPGYCHPGGVFAFSEATGAPAYDWQTVPNSVNGGGAVWASVTYDGSRLLFGTGNTCSVSPSTSNAIVSLSTLANFLWTDQTANPLTDDDVGGSVAEIGGTAYASAKNGSTYAIEPASGSIEWSHSYGAPDGQGGFSTPVMSGSTLVVSGGFPGNPYQPNPSITQYGMLFGVDRSSGAVHWEQQAVSPYWGPPATTSDLVITTDDANVEDLDGATGAVLWSKSIYGISRAQPAIANGEVFVVDQSGRVYAFALPTDANASIRLRSANVLNGLPAHNVVPISWKTTPAYCKK
jgi:outer membrane protein assembly factor BamB